MSTRSADRGSNATGNRGALAPADRVFIVATAVIAAAALAARLHDVVAYPPIADYDASSHAANVLAFLDLRLPSLRSWGGSHAPLYYMVGAALCAVLPVDVPMHVALRCITVLAWAATVALVWRTLRRATSAGDAAATSALLLGVPGIVIVTCMMTNDTLSACFVTAALVRLLAVAPEDHPSARHAAWSGALAALAALTKATGAAAIAITAGFYAWHGRGTPRQALRNVAAVVLVSTVIAGPHYARLFLALSGSAYDIVGTRAGSLEKRVVERVTIPAAPTSQRFPSWPGLVHAALWGDPTVTYLPRNLEPWAGALSAAGWIVTVVAIAGVLRFAWRRDLARRSGVGLVFGVFYAALFVPVVPWEPYLILTKVNYMLPAALSAALVVATGLGAFRGALGAAVRTVLLAIAAGGVAYTWYGWWEDAPRQVAMRPRDLATPARTVERWFAERAPDPIRALARFAPEQDLAHDLRLVGIFRIPYTPAPGFTPADDRTLEIDRARMAWLELHNLERWIRPVAAALEPTIVAADERDGSAEVRVRVAPRHPTPPPAAEGMGPWPFRPFEQAFTLRRIGARWRITRIAQADVGDENAVPAFVANPTLQGFEHLRALGWHPVWERAIERQKQATP